MKRKEEIGMPKLAYYQNERDVFMQEYGINLTDSEAVFICQKLAKKYKLLQRLEFFGNRQSGACSPARIRLSHNPSIAIISHEVAHAIQYMKFKKKYGYINGNPNLKKQRWHTKRHSKIMRKICDYINKNVDQWRIERKERSERECTRFERRLKWERQLEREKKTPEYKLERVRKSIKIWEGKRRRAENRLKKLQKREKIYMKQLQIAKTPTPR
jgi:hypothetical protein